MTIRRPESSGTPEDGDRTASIADSLWQRLLEDSERAIRESAPKEPSAQERVAGAAFRLPEPAVVRPQWWQGGQAEQDGLEAVGELWQPEDRRIGPAWRDMDARARLRRVGRVLGTVVAIAVVLGVMSRVPSGPKSRDEQYSEATPQESEDVPDDLLPTATTRPSVLVSGQPSSPTAHPR